MAKLLKLLEVLDSPETVVEFINEMMVEYKPVIYSIIGEFFEVYKDLNENDEFFAERAKNKQRTLEAYVTIGFTRDEALLFLLDSDLRKDRMMALLMRTQVQTPANNA